MITKFKYALSNTLCTIRAHGTVHPIPHFILMTLGTLQSISLMANSSSQLFLITEWFEISNYIGSDIVSILVFIPSFLLLTSLIILLITQSRKKFFQNTSTPRLYLMHLISYLNISMVTIIMTSSFRSSIQSIKNNQNLSFAFANLILLFFVSIPFATLKLSDFSLTQTFPRFINNPNILLVSSFFRLYIILVDQFAPSIQGFLLAPFVFLYIFSFYKQPVIAYTHDRIIRLFHLVLFMTTFYRFLQQIIGGQMFIIYLLLIALTLFFIQRIIIQRKCSLLLNSLNWHSFKILIQLIQSASQDKATHQTLIYYLVTHANSCTKVTCKCHSLMNNLAKPYQSKFWYQFLLQKSEEVYCYQNISKLPLGEQQNMLNQMVKVIIDQAQVQLFRLKFNAKAYYRMTELAEILKKKDILPIGFEIKQKLINYFIETMIEPKQDDYAANYFQFQIKFQTFRRLMLKSANNIALFWQQYVKLEPIEKHLLQYLDKNFKYQESIRQSYAQLVQIYQDCIPLLDTLVKRYSQLVLNIQPQSPYNLLKKGKKIKNGPPKVAQNMKIFSYDSNTPLCVISVDLNTFGAIRSANIYFTSLYSTCSNIENLMIAEMRGVHNEAMKQFVKKGDIQKFHRQVYILDPQGRLNKINALVQIVPSLSEGLSYVFFVKKRYQGSILLATQQDNQNLLAYSKEKNLPYNPSMVPQLARQYLENERQYNEGDNYQYNVNQLLISPISVIQIFVSGQEEEMGFQNIFQKTSLLQARYISMENENALEPKYVKQNEQIITYIHKAHNCRNIKKWIIYAFIALIILIAFSGYNFYRVSSALSDAQNATKTNLRFNNLVNGIIKQVQYLQIINFNSFIGNIKQASQFKRQLENLTLIANLMQSFLEMVQGNQLNQIWNSFLINSTGIINSVQSLNFVAISNGITTSLLNLITLNISSFNFSIYRPLVPLPLSISIQYYFTDILTSIYSVLPSLKTLNTAKVQPIIMKKITHTVLNFIFSVFCLLFILIFVLISCFLQRKIKSFKTSFYNLLQTVTEKKAELKRECILQFCNEYKGSVLQSKKNEKNEGEDFSQQSFRSDQEKERMRTPGDRTLQSFYPRMDSIIKVQETQQSLARGETYLVKNNKNNKPKIFKPQNCRSYALKYVFMAIFFIIVLLSYPIVSEILDNQIQKAIEIQTDLEQTQNIINMIKVYATELGLYELKTQTYINIPQYLSSLIQAGYTLQRKYQSNMQKSSMLTNVYKTLNTFANQNICNLYNTYFVNLNITFDVSKCVNVSQSLLTNGYLASLTGYLQSANVLLLSNPNTLNYTIIQRINLLLSEFHQEKSQLIFYFKINNNILRNLFQIDFNNLMSNDYNIMVIFGGIYFLSLLIFFITCIIKVTQNTRSDINSLKSVAWIISYRTMQRDSVLAKSLYTQQKQYKFLK